MMLILITKVSLWWEMGCLKKDWRNVRRFCLSLHKFYELTIKVSGSSYVTSNRFFDDICNIYAILCNWQTNSYVELNVMAKRMKDKFDKYWENVENMNMLLYIASVLDPRHKLEFVRFYFLKMYDPKQSSVIINNVKKKLKSCLMIIKKDCNLRLSKLV